MTECLPDLPRYIRQRDNQWQGADHSGGPWRPIPAPQSGLPWLMPPTTEESSAPHPTPADRLALALCPDRASGDPCLSPCDGCRAESALVATELAQILRERHGGSSAVADWLDGIGAHP